MKPRETTKARLFFKEQIRFGPKIDTTFVGQTLRDRDGVVCFYEFVGEPVNGERAKPQERSVLVPWSSITQWEIWS